MKRILILTIFASTFIAAQFFTNCCLAQDDDEAIGSFVHESFDKTNSAMVIGLVDERGKKIFAGGKLDNGTENEVDGDSIFFIGSVSKTFTALLLQEMADRGEVALDDAVAKYLPESVKVPAFNGKQITLLNLATHSAGLPVNPSNMTGADVREQYETYSIEKMYAFLSGYTLDREPGKEYSYSNVGMALLGHALARRAGSDLESLLLERICRPLKMEDTCITLSEKQKTRLALGHDAAGQPSPPFKLQAYSPAGGIHSSANDLLKYVSAQVSLTQSGLTPSMTKTHEIRYQDTRGLEDAPNLGVFGRTAMDWVDRGALQPEGMDLLGHAGGAGSYHAFVGFDQKQRRGVVVLTTANNVWAESIGWTLLQRRPLTRENAKDFARDIVGIGTAIELSGTPQVLRITRVIPNSPAASAGLQSGQLIKSIDGTSLENKNLNECLKLLRGPVGTKVRLDLSDANGASRLVDVTRQRFMLTN